MNVENFVSEFHTNFDSIKKKPIVLYGIGMYTDVILKNITDFNFIGLMDRKNIGNIIYGMKVLSEEEVEREAQVIIIVSDLSVGDVIYNRIKHLKEQYGIDIFYLNGFSNSNGENIIVYDKYFDMNKNIVENEILKNDVISFDIFDTLIMRKCLKPSDVFELLDIYLKNKKIFLENFCDIRKKSEKVCYRNFTQYFDLDLIYEQIKNHYNISDDLVKQIKNKELEFEYNFLIPRSDVVELFNYSKSLGKVIVLTSDMYLNKSIVIKFLDKCGIFGYDELFISCEMKKNKLNGSMWSLIRDKYKKKNILHIGDNYKSDIEMTQKFNINTIEIKKSYDLFVMSGINRYLNTKKDFLDNLLIGMFVAKAFNSPFCLNKGKGKLYIKDMSNFGYLFFGPLAFNYILWLINNAKEQRLDAILFIARDGYVLKKICDLIDSKVGTSKYKKIYFLTSRRASSVACIIDDDDIKFIINNMCNTASVKMKDLLYEIFGINVKCDDELKDKAIYELGKDKVIEHLLKYYREEILLNAKAERQGYLRYIEDLDVKKYSNIGLVNFVSRGVTQLFVSKLLKKELKGFYFAAEEDIAQFYKSLHNIFALYGKNISTHTSKLNLISKYLFGEVIFSAPQEQLTKFDFQGNPIYSEKTDRNFNLIEACHEGMIKYAEDMLKLDIDIDNFRFNNNLVDEIFGLFFKNNVICSNEVYDAFKFYDRYSGNKKVSLTNRKNILN